MRNTIRTNRRGGALRRTAAAASLTLIAAAVPVALATPASASPSDCTAYLKGRGYTIGAGVKKACAASANIPGPVGDDACWKELLDLHVKGDYAIKACDLA